MSKALALAVLGCLPALVRGAADVPYEVAAADLREPIIWASECSLPDGRRYAFGGHDQRAADGTPPTREWVGGEWHDLRARLRAAHPFRGQHQRLAALVPRVHTAVAEARHQYFEGQPSRAAFAEEILSEVRALAADLAPTAELPAALHAARAGATEALDHAVTALADAPRLTDRALLVQLHVAHRALALARDFLGAEPPPRALASFVFDPASGLCVLFGGDHFDYLSNDLWVFDPDGLRWSVRLPAGAPPPRADHQAKITQPGRLVVSGGYRYRDRFDYRQSPYAAAADGDWTYEIAADRWLAPTEGAERRAPFQRQYRAGPFAPARYWPTQRPDRAAHGERLAALPPNAWVALEPPQRPQRGQARRTWGTAVFDPARDVILQWGGGHDAHGGTDVLHYHLATNLWEQPAPIEYPLGQMYSSAEYPGGVSFNGNPWMIMHAYKSYAYSDALGQLVLTGRTRQWKFGHDPFFYRYDAASAAWVSREPLPEPMYGVQYFLKAYVVDTADGLVSWGPKGLFVLNARRLEWQRQPTRGARLPVASADGGGLAYDARRHQLLIATKPWKPGGAGRFEGGLHAVDLATGQVTERQPSGAEQVTSLFLREPAYDPVADLVVWAHQAGQGTIVYDPAADAWRRLPVTGDLSFGFSTGHVYDAARGVHWSVDDAGAVHALRLDLESLSSTSR